MNRINMLIAYGYKEVTKEEYDKKETEDHDKFNGRYFIK